MTERNVKIAPSILSADFAKLGEELKKIEEGGADMVHVDVMDGHFVPNITIGAPVVKSVRKVTSLPLDVHLMIENPDLYIEDFAKAGANIITVHVEACRHLHRTVQLIKDLNISAGVVLNPATPISVISDIIGYVDMVLLMSVNPGFGGQKFIPSVLDKIKSLKDMIDKNCNSVDIQVDGGIKVDNAKSVIDAGANILVAGSAVFYSDDYGDTISKLKNPY